MNVEHIREAVLTGHRAADIALASQVPITVVHRIAHGRGSAGRVARHCACTLCGGVTARRGGIYPLCSACRAQQERLRTVASLAVRKAIRAGELRPARERMCTDCGHRSEVYDHRDYSNPLVVDPVCRSCNAKRGPAVIRGKPVASPEPEGHAA